MHRLVQDVTRRGMAADASRARLAEALNWMNAAFAGDPQDVRTWPRLDPLAAHALAVTQHADTAGIADPTARLMNNLGQLFDAKARLAEAEPLMRRALAIGEKAFGPDHPNVAIGLNNLAALLQATNRLAEAEPMYRRALAIDETGLRARTIRTSRAPSTTSPDCCKPPTGSPRRSRCIAARWRSTRRPSGRTIRTSRATSTTSPGCCRPPTGSPRRSRCIAAPWRSTRQAFGPDHPNVAIDLNNLAELLQATNRLAEAEPLMRRALAIDETSFGPDHPNVANGLNNLALLLQATNRLAEAEPL